MKTLLRILTPSSVLTRYRQFRLARMRRKNSLLSVEQVFTKIYEQNTWGGSGRERDPYYSGYGTTDDRVVSPYVAMIFQKASSECFAGLRFVDLGCGDFRIGGKMLPLCSTYVGADIVQPLVEYNQAHFGSDRVQFRHLDIVDAVLPDGDVCFLRQVLQHLSNDEIVKVLGKLRQYRWVFITEHYPSNNEEIRPNIDKVHGPDVRAYDSSGVYLTEPPFDLPQDKLELVLEVPGTELNTGCDRGVIRTFLYKPNR